MGPEMEHEKAKKMGPEMEHEKAKKMEQEMVQRRGQQMHTLEPGIHQEIRLCGT